MRSLISSKAIKGNSRTFKEAYKKFLDERIEKLDAIKTREDLLAYVMRTHRDYNNILYLLTYMLLSIRLKGYDFFESHIKVTHLRDETLVEYALYFSLGSKPYMPILYKKVTYPVTESLFFLRKDEDDLKEMLRTYFLKI